MEAIREDDIVFTPDLEVGSAISAATKLCGSCEFNGRSHRRKWGFPVEREERFDKNGFFAWRVAFYYD